MGLRDLVGKDYQPVANVEGFDIIEGTYGVKVSALRLDQNKKTKDYDRYLLELTVDEVKSGTQAMGRKFWKRYQKDQADDMQSLLNDLFTMGVSLNVEDSYELFEAQFPIAIGAVGTVRAWKWTPEKDQQGNIVPEADRIPRQQFRIIKKAAQTLKTNLPF